MHFFRFVMGDILLNQALAKGSKGFDAMGNNYPGFILLCKRKSMAKDKGRSWAKPSGIEDRLYFRQHVVSSYVELSAGHPGLKRGCKRYQQGKVSRKLLRFTDIFSLGNASAATLAVVGCRSDEGKISLWILGVKLFFDICA
jgi:hypothetical protein